MDLDPASASRLVRSAVQGEAATQFSDLDRKLDVRVRASEDQRSVVAELGEPRGRAQRQGRSVPLGRGGRRRASSRGPARSAASPSSARRWCSANLKGARPRLGGHATSRPSLDGMRGARRARKVALAGQNRELAESFGSLRFAILLAVFLVYLVMASQFESLLHPFVIMFTLPMALVGVIADAAA